MNWTVEKITTILDEVKDPEIPVLTVADLGIIRKVAINSGQVEVTITPTYSGCPATKVIEDDIRAALAQHGIDTPNIKTVLSPAWTTDWITESGKAKLREYGIAPPEETTADAKSIMGTPRSVTCPHCKAKDTKLVSQFGSTPCKAHYQCNVCLEPFDYFKCI